MMIPFGILSAAGVSDEAGTYELIETQILGSNQASITFSNLGNFSTTYKHLQLRYVARSSIGDIGESISVRVNDISTTSYSQHRLFGTGSSVISSAEASQTQFRIGFISGSTFAANAFGAGVVDVLDVYGSKNKTFRSLSGNATAIVALSSGAFLETTAVTSLVLRSETGANFVTGSRFSLYGIRG
jgi:hypothetical protein